MKSKDRTVQMKGQYIYIPANTRERFLNSPSPPVPYLKNNSIAWIGISNITNGYRVDRHNFKSHFILYTIDGAGYLKIKNKPCYKLRKGKVFIAPATSEYSYWTDQNWNVIWAHLLVDSFWDKLIPANIVLRKAVWAKDLQREMETYLTEMNRFRADSSRALHAYVDLIALYLQRELEKNHPKITAAHHALETVWNEVQRHLNHPWEIEELASLAHMSRSALYRAVKKQTGFTPLQVVHSMRMEHASTLLLYTDCTLSSVAEAVGYEDQFSFSKSFKRYTGSNPTQFRQINTPS